MKRRLILLLPTVAFAFVAFACHGALSGPPQRGIARTPRATVVPERMAEPGPSVTRPAPVSAPAGMSPPVDGPETALESASPAMVASGPAEGLERFLESRRHPPDPGGQGQVRPGDQLRVREPTMTELNGTYLIGSAGVATFPVIGEVPVGGKDQGELEIELNRRLEVFMFDPQAEIEILGSGAMPSETPTVMVEGAVGTPGHVSLDDEGTTLVEAISIVGGLSPDAGSVIRIRPGDSPAPGLFAGAADAIEIPTRALLQADVGSLYLRSGDIVRVPRAGGDGPGTESGESPTDSVSVPEIGTASATATHREAIEAEISHRTAAARAGREQRKQAIEAERAAREQELARLLARIRGLPDSADPEERARLYDEANAAQIQIQQLREAAVGLRAPVDTTAIRREVERNESGGPDQGGLRGSGP